MRDGCNKLLHWTGIRCGSEGALCDSCRRASNARADAILGQSGQLKVLLAAARDALMSAHGAGSEWDAKADVIVLAINKVIGF